MTRASFTTLPMELKAKIVKMASDQEDAWKERVWCSDELAGHINCLSSLALVSRELRTLAAKHQFEVLDAHRASLEIFRWRLLRKFGHHFIEINFTPRTTTSDIETVLLSMDRLPSLRTLRISPFSDTVAGRSLAALFEEPDPGDEDEDERRAYKLEILASIAPRIETLILKDINLELDADDAASTAAKFAFIRHFPRLKTLGLLDLWIGSNEDTVRDLASVISSLRALKSLSIDLHSESGDEVIDSVRGWSIDALAPLEENPPPIQSLQLGHFPLHGPMSHLTQIFSPTLTTLCLPYGEGGPMDDLTSLTPIKLPLLKNFLLSYCGTVDITQISSLLLSASALTLFVYKPDNMDMDADMDAESPPLLNFLKSQPTLRRFELGGTVHIFPMYSWHQDPPPPKSIAAYANLLHSRGLDPGVLDALDLSPFHLQANLDYTSKELHLLTSVLGRTLAFGQVELERMVAEGNVRKAVEWVATLKALEDERLLTPQPHPSSITYSSGLGRTLAFGQVELERMIAEGDVKKAVGWVATLKALENERLAWRD